MPTARADAPPAKVDARPCIHAKRGKRTKTCCGKGRQQWICSEPGASKGMPPGGWPEKHCLRGCRRRIEPGREHPSDDSQERSKPMKIACVITAFNEGDEVRRTVESWLASIRHDQGLAVVVDDGSTDGSCEGIAGGRQQTADNRQQATNAGLPADGSLLVIRHEKPLGVGRSRNAGLAAALEWGADVVSFHDAHMRFPDGVMEALAREAVESGAVVCSKAKGWWDPDGTPHKFVAWGADLHWNLQYGLQAKYRTYAKDKEPWTRVPCPMGACYVMSRETIRVLSKPTGRLWDDVAGRWGFSEQALAVKAFLLGAAVLVSRDHQTHHHYRSANPVPNAHVEVWRNACFSMAAILSPETFDRRLRPYCDVYLGPALTEELAAKSRRDMQRPWTPADEERIFTDLCGRGARITEPHADHAWLAELSAACSLLSADSPLRILQWRPGESTLLVKRRFPGAEIKCLEWEGHRAKNWQAILHGIEGVSLLQIDLESWTDPVSSGHLKADERFDLITIGGERQEECRAIAQRLLAPDGRIVVNPTADRHQIAGEFRHAADRKLEAARVKEGLEPAPSPDAPRAAERVREKIINLRTATPTVTVLLLNWKRPENIGKIMNCLRGQTLRPRLVLWDNGFSEDGGIKFRSAEGVLMPMEQHPAMDCVVYSGVNLRCFPRWWLASRCETEYVCSMDDDIILADERVLEDAVKAQRDLCPEGIVGPWGVRRVPGKSYKGWRHINGRSHKDVRVDLIKGRFMCLRTDLLSRVPLLVPGAGHREDDIYVSLAISRGEPDFHLVPGVLGGRIKELGVQDGRAMALQPAHYEKRDEAFRRLADHFTPIPERGRGA